MSQELIEDTFNDVSDTAHWVAEYRAIEHGRSNRLFADPYAYLLASEKGKRLSRLSADSKYVEWTVIIRTYVIDKLINTLLLEGVDMVINLGAGLDTRPYRMDLPESLLWIEVDSPSIIEFKTNRLIQEKPKCKLRRVSLDLTNLEDRHSFFSKINAESKKILVLTEGVLPYLTEAEVSSLAAELYGLTSSKYWIAEYHSPEMYKHLRSARKIKEMGKARFKFFPEDWLLFFEASKWGAQKIIYLVEEAKKLERSFPLPWWAKVLHLIAPAEELEKFHKMVGFCVYTKNN